jgi:hypothetical protein
MIRITPALVWLVVCLTVQPCMLRAADHASDEAAIRALIAQLDAGKTVPRTEDRVFGSGAYRSQ